MANRLTGKTCLITGAAQGIGHAIAEAFLREGAAVIATDLQHDRLQATFAGRDVRIAQMDVTDSDAVAQVAAAHPDVNVLVNCAGWVAVGTILSGDPADLDRSFRINVMAMANTIRAFLPAMRDRRSGSIVNIASVVSSVMAAPDRFAYATSKAAVVGLTMSVARDFIGEGIRCNAISPGTVETPSLGERLRQQGDEAAARAAFVARQPMGRIGTPQEIAEIAVLLASDEAGFMTGSNLIIDGGMSL
ncbi:SDR family oxidoreductase [Sphingobium aquiterrae]|uniref:SDR family oxidoreductase n=1 Tax=Sphingobium aquiterrae TaxID=2038656 RepID=UPI0030166DB7